MASCVGVKQLAVAGHLLAAAAWNQHGSPDLALAAALTALSGFRGAARAEDQCLAYAQLATFAFQRRGYRRGYQPPKSKFSLKSCIPV